MNIYHARHLARSTNSHSRIQTKPHHTLRTSTRPETVTKPRRNKKEKKRKKNKNRFQSPLYTQEIDFQIPRVILSSSDLTKDDTTFRRAERGKRDHDRGEERLISSIPFTPRRKVRDRSGGRRFLPPRGGLQDLVQRGNDEDFSYAPLRPLASVRYSSLNWRSRYVLSRFLGRTL